MAYILRPPTVTESFGRPYALWWVSNRRGITLMKTAGVWDQVEYPDMDMIDNADLYFLGGHEYELTQEQYDDLVAAGYGAYIEIV